MPAVQLHLRRTGAHVWVVEIAGAVVLHGVPSLSRILRNFHPVILAVLNIASVLEGLSEELAEVVVVRGIFETEVANISQVLAELLGEALAKILDGGCLLLLANLLVLLLVSSSLETLPRKAATEEVEENMTKRLEIVTSRLLATKMGIDTHIASGSGQ